MDKIDTKAMADTIIGHLIICERYTYADHRVIAAVVRETLALAVEAFASTIKKGAA